MAGPEERRRTLLRRSIRWATVLVLAALVQPLLRFAGFSPKAKPRQVLISKVLPVGGYHLTTDFILFVHEEGALAVSRVCTHLGCRLNYRTELKLIECPCHQSRFTPSGERIAGPARAHLQLFPVKIQKDSTGIVTGYLVSL